MDNERAWLECGHALQTSWWTQALWWAYKKSPARSASCRSRKQIFHSIQKHADMRIDHHISRALWHSLLVSSATFFVGVVLLVGCRLGSRGKPSARLVSILSGLGVGALLGDAFLHGLPHAYSRAATLGGAGPVGPEGLLGLTVAGGVIGFAALESAVHSIGSGSRQQSGRHRASINLLADGLHNFADGMVIGAAFLSGAGGLHTSAAMILHEVPQELGDFGLLLRAGLSPGRALLANTACALSCLAGTVVVCFFGNAFSDAAVLLLQAASSGGFIYLATSTLAEQQHAPRPKGRGRWAALPFYAAVLVGIAAVLAVHELPLGGHSHGGCSHSHDPAAGGGGAAGRHRSGHASSLRHHDEQPGHGQEHNEGRTALVAGRAAAAAEVADG